MKRYFCLILFICVLLTACTPAVHSPSETEVSLEGKKLIALTFDDGPNNIIMPYVLDLLEEANVPATFFLIGQNIKEDTKQVILRAKEMGCEIGNHSYSHSNMTLMTANEIRNDYGMTQDLIEDITGERPIYFRPPFLSFTKPMCQNIDAVFIGGFGFTDWKEGVTKEDIQKGMYDAAEDGAIFYLHVTRYETVQALKEAIPFLRNDGYEFVTLSKLFEMKGVTPAAHDGILYKVIE